MNDRLSPSDVSSLLADQGPIHVHVGGTLILEGDPPGYEELCDHVEGRLRHLPRFRQRVKQTPLNMSNPVWADDRSFDLRRHVRHAALPAPGDMAQLRDLVARIMSQRLDLRRPLWQLYLIEGLENGQFALLSKTHHALVDGVAALDVGTVILDPTEEGVEEQLPDEPWEPDEPSPQMLFVRSATDRIRGPLRTARKAAEKALTMPRGTASEVFDTAEAFAELASGGPSSPESPLNVEIGSDRRVAYVQAPLEAFKDARADSEATVNDVILAVATAGITRFLQGRGVDLPEHLVALVPVSLRQEGEDTGLGNRISTILVRLPMDEADPAQRLATVHQRTQALKNSEQARASSLVTQATGWTPPTINRLLSGALARQRVFNLVVSNVPGPQQPFYLLGRPLRQVFPYVPLSPQGHALSIGVMSYDGCVFIGLVGDWDEMRDLDDLASCIGAAVSEQTGAEATVL